MSGEEMDMSQFREIFLSESKENLQVLNQSLVALEKNPDDMEKINAIFRVAHTLKGMAATMGFEKITKISHHMEDVLDKIRKGTVKLNTKIVDILFQCLDSLEKLIDTLDQDQSREIVALDPLIKLLSDAEKGIFSNQTEPAQTAPAQAAVPPATPPAPTQTQASPPPAVTAPPQTQTQPEPKAAETPPEARIEAIDDAEGSSGQAQQSKQSQKSSLETIRVNVSHLDMLMNLVGEMVINKGRLEEISEQLKVPELEEAISFFDRLGTELQEAVLKTRMVPVSHIFDRFPRMVRDLGRKLGKEVDLDISGADIEIDRTLLEQINEPLVHILRNAIDHGLETTADRTSSGKTSTGKIFLNARREQSAVVITVADDGRGMDAEILKKIAVERNIITQEVADKLTEKDAFYLICDPRFSSSKQVTDISGRGVGMDVVRSTVESFNGILMIDSKKGAGSTFVLKLPLSLAIIRALLVQVHDEVYALPLSNIIEIVSVEIKDIKTIDQQEVIVLRNTVLPLVRLDKVLGTKVKSTDDPLQSMQIVVVEVSDKKVGFVVNRFVGRKEIVVKTLTGIARNAKGFTGATILGDGRVVLIIDTGVWV